ncbi:MAG TPA: hypothetical protein PK536_05840 [Ignavibacteria bacterium]|nr:hypothetical protein [Bacteroidota bacterium]HRI84952.1 hypothetical protein [Ignavibacteria bacterium]HRJ99442.1 hypothetical protein [Ignavibacteria bacterium]
MTGKKSQNKNSKNPKKPKKKAEEISEEYSEDDNDDIMDSDLISDREIDEMLENESLGELDEEDDEEFIQKVEEFKKEHSKSKMIKVYDYIGKPKFPDLKKLDSENLKKELRKLIVALDSKNIIVHSHGDPDNAEKYRFITEEIFSEYVEDKKGQHITFVYEDYHPEMDDDEDEEFL